MQEQKNYIVWVGGLEVGRHKCPEAAGVTAASWRKDGYEDVAIAEYDRYMEVAIEGEEHG